VRPWKLGLLVLWATLACSAFPASEGRAEPFGATILSDGGNVALSNCAPYVVLLDVPINLSAQSRLYADATAVAPSGTGIEPPSGRVSLQVVVINGNDTILGSTTDSVSSDQSPNYAVHAILHAGSTPWDVTAAPLLLPEGSFHAQVRLLFRYNTDNCVFSYGPITMTYMILSAAGDRLFADGFA
jgi:hypothetical protein